MTIQSMTAFASVERQGEWGTAVWECRCVNHRYLEPSIRLPEAFRSLEPNIREITRDLLHRGKVEATLRFQAGPNLESQALVNLPLAKSLQQAGEQIQTVLGDAKPLTTMDFLRWPGMVMMQDKQSEQVLKEILDAYRDALTALVKDRAREGEAIQHLLSDRLKGMRQQVTHVRAIFPEIQTAEREKIQKRLEETKIEVDPNRLEQELVFIAQKTDIAEELDRLETHFTEIESILNKGGVVGRRLDFLMQELNREANTLGSKSIHKTTTAASVELKVLIEQMREQIQNIE